MRSRIVKRLSADADKLIGLSVALAASGSRTEDSFWETRIDAVLNKLIRNGSQTTLDAALDHLQANQPDVYGALADQAETRSESISVEHEGAPWEAILVAVPVLAWTRYVIPSGPLKPDTVEALRNQLQAHVLATGTLSAVAPLLYSIDQLPRHHVEAYRLGQQLTQAALAGVAPRITVAGMPETAPILADPRFVLAAVAAPAGAALFRWQEDQRGTWITRAQCLEQWTEQAGASIGAALPGCEFECLLPDAFYSACRDADERIRPHMVRTSVRYLEDTLNTSAKEIRAVIGGFGDQRIDEYRISFTRRGDTDVVYGVLWPLFGSESADTEAAGEPDDPAGLPGAVLDGIVDLLKQAGIVDIRRHVGRFDPEYCDDCGVPLYLDPLGDVVHAEMPDDATEAAPHFH